MKSSNIGVVYF